MKNKETPPEGLDKFIERLTKMEDKVFYVPADSVAHAKSAMNKVAAIDAVKEMHRDWLAMGYETEFSVWNDSPTQCFVCAHNDLITEFRQGMASERWAD